MNTELIELTREILKEDFNIIKRGDKIKIQRFTNGDIDCNKTEIFKI